jgi:hypothetical protein
VGRRCPVSSRDIVLLEIPVAFANLSCQSQVCCLLWFWSLPDLVGLAVVAWFGCAAVRRRRCHGVGGTPDKRPDQCRLGRLPAGIDGPLVRSGCGRWVANSNWVANSTCPKSVTLVGRLVGGTQAPRACSKRPGGRPLVTDPAADDREGEHDRKRCVAQ